MIDDALINELAEYSNDPLGFVLFAFPWGEEGSEIEQSRGPEPWQIELLKDLGTGVLSTTEAVRLARTSGHGVGKSALVAWIILWAMSTFVDTRGVITANTETQLKTKTWVELAKWYRLFIGREMFHMAATSIYSADPEHERTWRIDMVPWSERNTEAFAGLHNKGRRILLVFDEASAIPDVIWQVAEGALTDKDTQIIWCVFSNPTRNLGRFRDCFPGGKFAHRWRSATVDSRTVSITDKKQIQEWIDDYGEDHDFVRVRVLGRFPRIDAESFIPLSLALEAVTREVEPQNAPIVLGVDVGRFGDDPSVIYPRCGRDARTWKPELLYGASTMETAARVAATALRLGAKIVYIDGGGVGGGVVDRCRMLGLNVVEVDFGSSPDYYERHVDGAKYANKRAEIWGALRHHLHYLAIDNWVCGDDVTFTDELAAPTYGLNNREEIQLESKKEMRRRKVPSPNVADALACTFAMPMIDDRRSDEKPPKPHVLEDYNPYDLKRIYA